MPVKLVPPSKNAAAEALMKLFTATEQKLIAEITRKRAQGYVDYAEVAALTRVRKTIQGMVDKSAEYVPLAIEKEFYKGTKKDANGYANARQIMTPGRTRAAEILTDNLMGQVQEMASAAYADTAAKLQLIGRPDADIFRALGVKTAAQNVAMGAGGMSGVEAMIKALQASGITAFVDKSGRPWSLRAYGNMAVRTTVRQAQVSAILTENEDHDLYKIVQHYAPCAVCAIYGGRVYSKSGTNPNYPPLAAAFGKIDPSGPNGLTNSFLNIHPNCLCTLIPYTEAGKTKEQIERDRERSSFEKHPADVDPRSKKEIEAYRTKERNRAQLNAELKEWQRMREQGVPGVPSNFQTFQKHKRADDDAYRRWAEAYTPPAPKKKQAQPEPVTPVFVSQYRPATTLKEAEELAMHYTDPHGFGALGVNFTGVSVDVANRVNKTIYDFYDEYNVPKFGGIKAPVGNSREGRLIQNATAAYSPIRKSFYLNRKSLKDIKTAEKALAEEQAVIKRFLAHPENFDLDRVSPRVRAVLMASKKSGRGTVPDTIEDVINHELGHSLEKSLKQLPNYQQLIERMPQYAESISGYATESFSEYVAESFASIKKGEKIADPEMVKAFNALRRK